MLVTKSDAIQTIVGGAAFWLPSIILHAFKGADFSPFHWRVLASVQPLSTLAIFIILCFLRRGVVTPKRIAQSVLLGIWILGPLCLFVNATFGGGGFAKGGAWLDLLMATLLFPLLTPWLSLYDGSVKPLAFPQKLSERIAPVTKRLHCELL
jgi:hypothetical protein